MTDHSKSNSVSSGQAAYNALLKAISDGTLKPGDRLREVEVSNLLNLSRTPIREALRRLESEGIVEHQPRIGAAVRKLSHTEIVELYEMRVVLEKTGAEMAAKHASDAEIDTLEDLKRGYRGEQKQSCQSRCRECGVSQSALPGWSKSFSARSLPRLEQFPNPTWDNDIYRRGAHRRCRRTTSGRYRRIAVGG